MLFVMCFILLNIFISVTKNLFDYIKNTFKCIANVQYDLKLNLPLSHTYLRTMLGEINKMFLKNFMHIIR